MFNDELQEDTTLENGVEETQDNLDADEEETSEDSAEEKDWEAEAKKWQAIANRKAKKLETPAPKQKTSTNNSLTEDDILVITTIQDKELINTAREIAKLKGITLSEAADSTMFRLAKAEREEAIKQEKVSMEASRGSGNRGKRKDFKTSGLTPAEHKELWRKRVGR